ncbi:protein FAR1-RELATED SEQUENCE [Citrus sinensis]|uniref:Protein FAR1-RELATED SEQUENCE n=1 Tax=Citrus sinensis TaxID=2711 RepID=A0ACB8I248_CITSI|nr:protein FAR1-RELATED SEQUENCE [Citrus sinensis]
MEYLENEHAFEELQETRANDVNEIVEPNKCEPALGMLFDNHEEMFAFYKAYGKQEGFPVKVQSTKKGTDGIVKYATFACGRSGKSESKSANALKPKPNVKNGCDAKIGGCLNEYGKWVLRTLNLQHNHGLSPDKARYFPCNRRISASAKKRIEMNDCAGIRIAQNFNSIVVGAGGYENVSFLEKDCRNFVDKTRRLQLEEGDAMALLKYFQKKQAECNGFFFSIDLDEDDRLKNVFWADSLSRAAYKYFRDVITFDTTYLTNKYDMPFAPFVGVNHHGQSILLGCKLISREDTETFTWLFEAWLSCMSDSLPLSIITYQDRAMQKAIENVFPTTRHRWCLWHIMKKVPEKLGAFKEREDIISSLLSAVYDSLSSDAFEEAWHCMIIEYDLWDNDWLNGMSITQRSESMNAFFDRFVNSKINLRQFVKQYENALRRKAELEWQADAKCFSKRTPCVSRYEMERQVEEVYTISKFKEFHEELTALMYCDISDSVGSIYQIIESFGQDRRGFFEVVFEEAECEVNCICSKFQFKGILCRHALAVLICNSVELLPERYILSRWRKDVRRCYSKLKVCYGVQNLTIQQERYEKTCNAFSKVADIASDDENSYKTVLDWIEKAMKDLPKQIRCESVGKTNTGGATCSSNKQINSESVERTVIDEVSCSSNNVQLALNDLVVTRRKGRPPCLRKESSICKKSVQKNKSAQKNKDLQENAPSSYHVPNEISTQGSNIATLHYSSLSMTYQGSQSENFQQLLQQQQRNQDNNDDT